MRLPANLRVLVPFFVYTAWRSYTVSKSSPACLVLSEGFHEQTFFPLSAEYRNSSQSYFSLFESDLEPGCVFRPRSAQALAAAIGSLQKVHPPAQLAIKGGGHTQYAGAANVDGGVTIDLSGLTGVSIDVRAGTASVGAGERWGNVYRTLGARDLTVAGGRVSPVGVAGLTLGG